MLHKGGGKVVCFNGRPSPIPESLMTELMRHSRILSGQEPGLEFKTGDKVTITEGAFKQIEAVVKAARGEERVIVLLSLLHKECELEIGASQVEL